jgi:transcriptional regulator with XRE-family HTH domain
LSLADVAGTEVSRAFIHQIEQGRSRPSQAVLQLIAKRTGRPVSFFTVPVRGGQPDDADLGVELSRLAARLKAFAQTASLTEPEREAVQLVDLLVRRAAKLMSAITSELQTSKAR